VPYGLKLFLYAALWCVAGSAIGYRWMSDLNFFVVFGVALLMAVVAVLLGRRLFNRKGL
jgi:hypothetical protein